MKIDRGQVFVRAMDPNGRYHSADILDLDEESFRSFVIGVLFQNGLVSGLKNGESSLVFKSTSYKSEED
jgi:hypothetical protein